MSRFSSNRVLSLDFLGDNWKDCSLSFSSLSVKESRELLGKQISNKTPEEIMDISSEVLKTHFIEGAGYDAEKKEIVKLTKEDLEELPSAILERAILFLVGETKLKSD